jgi:hypothetical protein
VALAAVRSVIAIWRRDGGVLGERAEFGLGFDRFGHAAGAYRVE